MGLKTVIMALLLVMYVLAPVVDVVACDDCREIAPLQAHCADAFSRSNHSDQENLTKTPVPPSSETPINLCPLCSNAASGMSLYNDSAPSLACQVSKQPKLLAFADPSYPITKPPQN